jgi:hypothetical protein
MAKRKIKTYYEGRIIGDNDMRQEVKQYINAGKQRLRVWTVYDPLSAIHLDIRSE